MKKNVLFAAKGGENIGLGHIKRSLAIAKHIRKNYDCNIAFVVNKDNALLKLLDENGFEHFIIDGISVDQLAVAVELFNPFITVFDIKEDVSGGIRYLMQKGIRTCLFDNITDARKHANIVIYPVGHFQDSLDWSGFAGRKYIGAEYFPLDEKFLEYNIKKNTSKKRFNILVTMGGSDPNSITFRVIKALEDLENIDITVLIGPSFKLENVEEISKSVNVNIKLKHNVSNVAEFMANADIAITAFGITLYELAYMGLPAIIIYNYLSDKTEVDIFQKLGTSISPGYYKDVNVKDILAAVCQLMENEALRKMMELKGKALVDGKGIERIGHIIME
jgi:spore coat polysaccharide biosynthesis predicted glycosyltransferase SpsG